MSEKTLLKNNERHLQSLSLNGLTDGRVCENWSVKRIIKSRRLFTEIFMRINLTKSCLY